MDRATQGLSGTGMKPLLLVCRPDFRLDDPLEIIPRHPALNALEIAVSRSAEEHGLVKPLAGGWPVFLAHEADALLRRLALFDLLIVCPLSLNTLAKFALGLKDSFPAQVLSMAAELGKPILLDSSAIPSPDSALNPHLFKIYKRYWDSVRGGTVREYHHHRLEDALTALVRHHRLQTSREAPPGRGVITRDDVWAARDGLGFLKVPPGSLITDLAREEAQSLGIRIIIE